MILYVDTALSGKYRYRDPDNDPNQPHLVRLAALLVDETRGEEMNRLCYLIEPRPGWIYEPDAVVSHGIPEVMAREQGKPLATVWETLGIMRAEAHIIVGFNWDHQRRVLQRTAADLGEELILPKVGEGGCVCAMRQAAPLVRKPRQAPGGGWAWPKLAEAYEYFTGQLLYRDPDPVAMGLQLVDAVRAIHEGIVRGGR